MWWALLGTSVWSDRPPAPAPTPLDIEAVESQWDVDVKEEHNAEQELHAVQIRAGNREQKAAAVADFGVREGAANALVDSTSRSGGTRALEHILTEYRIGNLYSQLSALGVDYPDDLVDMDAESIGELQAKPLEIVRLNRLLAKLKTADAAVGSSETGEHKDKSQGKAGPVEQGTAGAQQKSNRGGSPCGSWRSKRMHTSKKEEAAESVMKKGKGYATMVASDGSEWVWKTGQTDQRSLVNIISYHVIESLGMGERVPRAVIILDKEPPYSPPCPFTSADLAKLPLPCADHRKDGEPKQACRERLKADSHGKSSYKGHGALIVTEKLPSVNVLQAVNLSQCFLDDDTGRSFGICDVPTRHFGDIHETRYCLSLDFDAKYQPSWEPLPPAMVSCADKRTMGEFGALAIVDTLMSNMDRYWTAGFWNNLFSTGSASQPLEVLFIDNAMQWLHNLEHGLGSFRDGTLLGGKVGCSQQGQGLGYLFEKIRLDRTPHEYVNHENHTGVKAWKGGFGGMEHHCGLPAELVKAIQAIATREDFVARVRQNMGQQQQDDVNHAFADTALKLKPEEKIVDLALNTIGQRYECLRKILMGSKCFGQLLP